jgi:hypothetical protein
MEYFKLALVALTVAVFCYVKRHGFRRAWYIIRTGAENPDWEKLGFDYFIAPWEKKRSEEKNRPRRHRRMLPENSQAHFIRALRESRGGAEV